MYATKSNSMLIRIISVGASLTLGYHFSLRPADVAAQTPISTPPAEVCDQRVEQSIRQKIAAYPKNPETHPRKTDLNGDIAALYYQLGDLFVCRNQMEKAIANYRLAISIDPLYPGPVDSVKTATRTVQEQKAKDAFAYFYLVKALKRTQNLQAAVPALRQIIALDPHFAQSRDVYYDLGTALIKQNKLDEAIMLYRQQVKQFPSGDAYFDLASALKLKGQTKVANAVQQRAIAIHPKYQDWTYREAKAYQAQGEGLWSKEQRVEAIAAYHKATELNPHQYELFERLGWMLWRNKQYQATVEIYEQGLRLNPNHPFARQNLIDVKEKLKKLPP